MLLIVGLLVGLNAASYTKIEQQPDLELEPNRSTYNAGGSGSRALYELLTAQGKKPMRWQEAPSALTTKRSGAPNVFVVIGDLRRPFTDEEADDLMQWVSMGGRLVLIDRYPNPDLLPFAGHWKIETNTTNSPTLATQSADQKALTDKVAAAKPAQPTTFVGSVNAVQISKFAANISLRYRPEDSGADSDAEGIFSGSPPPARVGGDSSKDEAQPSPTPLFSYDKENFGQIDEMPEDIAAPPPAPKPTATPASAVKIGQAEKIERSSKIERLAESPPPLPAAGPASDGPSVAIAPKDEKASGQEAPEAYVPTAPVVHLSNPDKNVLVDYPYGAGRIILLSDPYVVSNAGIKLVDNATLAVNLVSGENAVIAFDEFHQGYGSENTLLRYFSGTPFVALIGQAFLLVAFVLWTRGNRFARPLPLGEPDRRSKLEYVAAMADLQNSTRAYDLAIENLYLQFRRRAARFTGLDNTANRRDLADAIARRTDLRPEQLEKLFFMCEEIMRGEPTSARETLDLAAQLREVEEKLGMKNRKRHSLKKI
jgi:hypothetical protein